MLSMGQVDKWTCGLWIRWQGDKGTMILEIKGQIMWTLAFINNRSRRHVDTWTIGQDDLSRGDIGICEHGYKWTWLKVD